MILTEQYLLFLYDDYRKHRKNLCTKHKCLHNPCIEEYCQYYSLEHYVKHNWKEIKQKLSLEDYEQRYVLSSIEQLVKERNKNDAWQAFGYIMAIVLFTLLYLWFAATRD